MKPLEIDIVNTTNKKKVIYGFDLLKFIMATLIVSIHTEAFETLTPPLYQYLRIIQNWCVPTFFLLSSYFFMRKFVKSNNNIELYLGFIKRLGILYSIWFVINLPVYISQHSFAGLSVFEVSLELMKGLIFASTFEGSWFISALVVSVSILVLFVCLGFNRWLILGIFTIVYLSMYMCMYAIEYDYIHANIIYEWYTTNIYNIPTLSFPRALPFIAMGYLMATFNNYVKIFNSFIRIIPMILITLMVVTVYIDCMMFEQIITLFAVPLIVIYFEDMKLPESNLWKLLRDSSILLYLLHFITIVFFRHIPVVCRFVGIPKYVAVLCAVGIISYLIIYLSKKPKTKFFQYLY